MVKAKAACRPSSSARWQRDHHAEQDDALHYQLNDTLQYVVSADIIRAIYFELATGSQRPPSKCRRRLSSHAATPPATDAIPSTLTTSAMTKVV